MSGAVSLFGSDSLVRSESRRAAGGVTPSSRRSVPSATHAAPRGVLSCSHFVHVASRAALFLALLAASFLGQSMLSISAMTGVGLCAYFKPDLSPEDGHFHYRESTIGAQEWMGSGAEAHDLYGKKVTLAPFRQLAKGLAPDGSKLRQNAGDSSDAAWDLTFSHDKDPSALYGCGDEDTRAVVLAIHQLAVASALELAEERFAFCRVGRGGNDQVPAKLVAATFLHVDSRGGPQGPDPNIHTHVVVFNCGLCPDGKWRALRSHDLYRAKMALGALYRAECARLYRELGVRIIRNGDSYRFADVPTALRDEFSQRRRAILKRAKELRLTSSAALERISLALRPGKTEFDAHDLRLSWRARALRYGFGEQQARAVFQRRGIDVIRSQKTGAKRAVRQAVAECIARGHVFGEVDVLRIAAARCQAGEAGIRAISEEASRWIGADPRLHCLGKRAGYSLYTTEDNLRLEEGFLARATSKPKQGVKPPSAESIRSAAKRHALSRDQFDALIHITQRPGNQILTGKAGTGKTRTFSALREVFESHGSMVIGLAPTGRAARELESGSGIKSMTLARFLLKLAPTRRFRAMHHARMLVRAAFKKGTWRLKPMTLPEKAVIVVDEAAMASLADLDALLRHADKSGAKVIFSGDDRQLGPVNATTPFSELCRRIEPAALETIWRHQGEGAWMTQANELLHAGEVDAALREFALRDKIHVVGSDEDPIQSVCDDWLKLRTRDPSPNHSRRMKFESA